MECTSCVLLLFGIGVVVLEEEGDEEGHLDVETMGVKGISRGRGRCCTVASKLLRLVLE